VPQAQASMTHQLKTLKFTFSC